MIHIGLKFSTSGVGDYWDDVDRWVRNQFVEQQLLKSEWAREVTKGLPPLKLEPNMSSEGLPEKLVGSFSYTSTPNEWWTAGFWTIACCNGNASRALYYVWENILNYKDGKLKVNLLLNRASKWADIDSYLPYQGKVAIKMKRGMNLQVRIPSWVTESDIECTIDGTEKACQLDGRYLKIGSVKAGQGVVVAFPLKRETIKITAFDKSYTLDFKGYNIVNVWPRYPDVLYPSYTQIKYRYDEPRYVELTRFVAEDEMNW